MCEFCTKHGEGKKWYENAKNYTEEVFRSVSSEKKFRKFTEGLYRMLTVEIPKAQEFKKRYPRIYKKITMPLVTRRLKKEHFGQIVPLEDIERIIDNFNSVVRLPCVCRKATLGKEVRWCMGIGMDLTHILKELPDYKDFDVLSREETVKLVRELDAEGKTHSIWTFGTPYIGAICNCDRDCMAYRFQHRMKLGQVMWKAEYVAEVDPERCEGCRECIKMCYFNAILFERKNEKCIVRPSECYGCGICRTVCKNGAITLFERALVPEAANVW